MKPGTVKLTPPSEKAVEAWVIDLFKKCGCHVWKTSQPRATMISEGLPDLWVFCPRRQTAWWFEVKNERAMKRPNSGLSFPQLKFAELCGKSEVLYFVGGLEEAKRVLALHHLSLRLEP